MSSRRIASALFARSTPTSNSSILRSRAFHPTRNSMTVTAITSYDQFLQVIKAGKPVIIDFWATWKVSLISGCGPCKLISPIFERMSETQAGEKIGFYKVDVEEEHMIPKELKISAMPTFVLFKDGAPVETVVGADASKLQAVISKHAV